jgi:hypothetical protein
MRITALGLLRDTCIVAIRESLKDSGDLPDRHGYFCRLINYRSNDKGCNPDQESFQVKLHKNLLYDGRIRQFRTFLVLLTVKFSGGR